MTKNPWLNALAAIVYICGIATMLFYGSRLVEPVDSLAMPIIMLSLLTFSVAMMAWIFFLEPIKLYVDGEKKVAVNLFLRTLGIFAAFILAALILLALFA